MCVADFWVVLVLGSLETGRALGGSIAAEEFFYGEADVPGDLAEQRGRDVAARVERDSCASSVGVSVLPMRSSLADL